MKQIILAIHEAEGQDITFLDDIAYSLVSGGGKPGQGYPCILIIYGDAKEISVRSCDKRER